jgi:hypothetical protein
MSSQVVTPNTEAAILARVLETEQKEMTPEIAQYFLAMKLPRSDEDRVNELSAKAREGSLTDAEAQELDGYLHVGSFLSVLQARARRLLRRFDEVSRPQ